MSLPYYKRYTRDLLDGTIGMGFELKLTYAFLIDLIMHHDGCLKDNPRYIAGQLECSVRKWNSMRSELIKMGKIYAENDFIFNLRATYEAESLSKYRDKQAENGKKSNKNKGISKTSLTPKLNHTDTDTDTDTDILTNVSISGKPPLPEKKEVKETPLSILKLSASVESAKSYCTYRTRIKKPLTITAANRLKKQLDLIAQNGGDASDALGLCEEKGWTSIKSDWYFNETGTQNSNDKPKYIPAAQQKEDARRNGIAAARQAFADMGIE